MSDRPWADMTADERRASRLEQWRKPSLEFPTPEAAADYKARIDRLIAALSLEIPDRVPVNITSGFWPAVHAGITPYDAMTDLTKAAKAWTEFTLDFKPDVFVSPLMYTIPGSLFETIDYKLYAWPGHGAAKDASYQYNEREWMLPEDYDALISDPTDFMLRTYLPRTVGAYAGFAGLSSVFDFVELPFVPSHIGGWGSPEMIAGLEKLTAAARIVGEWSEAIFPVLGQLMAAGFPPYFGGATKAPFDILGDTLRGTKGVIMDMFRQPDKVVAACERLVPVAIDWVFKRPGGPATPVIFIPLHKGADGFMSDEQFHKFYWPTLRAVLLGLIEEGCIPFLFAEGRYGSRLEAIMDLPKGKTVWLFDQTDMARAKKTIGTVACIQGNVPLSLIYAGTPQETVEYTRGLIDSAAEGGGFILDVGAVADGGKPENLHAMIETAAEYGRY